MPPVYSWLGRPASTAQIFANGKLVILGAKGAAEAREAARAHARAIAKALKVKCRLSKFKVANMVCRSETNFPLSLLRFHQREPNVRYNPETEACANYRMESPKVSARIWSNGQIVINGAKTIVDADAAMRKLIALLHNYKS